MVDGCLKLTICNIISEFLLDLTYHKKEKKEEKEKKILLDFMRRILILPRKSG